VHNTIFTLKFASLRLAACRGLGGADLRPLGNAEPALRVGSGTRLRRPQNRAHGVFGILALLLWRALAGTTAWRRPWAWAFALTLLYAASDEFHQGFVAGRHPSATDVAIDATGSLIALVAVGLIRSRRA
jgi:hypothetical protein